MHSTTSLTVFFGVTHTCIPAFQWMPVCSAHASASMKPTAFALGEEVMASSGQPVRLGRPLDWLVITDHSDGMGFFNDLAAGDPDIIKFDQAKPWYEGLQAGGDASVAAVEQENFFGKATNAESSPRRMLHPFMSTKNGSFNGYQLD